MISQFCVGPHHECSRPCGADCFVCRMGRDQFLGGLRPPPEEEALEDRVTGL